MKTIIKPIVLLLSLLILTTCSKDPEPEQASSTDIIQDSNSEDSETETVIEEIPDIRIFDVISESNEIWDYWILDKNGDNIYVKLKNDIPVYANFFSSESEEGFTVFFNPKGSPEKLVDGQTTVLFDNHLGHRLDLAIIHTEGHIRYLKNVPTEINSDFYDQESKNNLKPSWIEYLQAGLRGSSCLPVFGLDVTALAACSSTYLTINDLNSPEDGESEIFGLNADEWSLMATAIDCTKYALGVGGIGCATGLIDLGIDLYWFHQELLDSIELTVNEANTNLNSPSSAPTIPSQPWPIVDADLRGDVVNLAWTSIDPDQENLTFDLYFGTNTTPNLFTSGIDESTYRINSLESGKRYYWSIRAIDPEGNMVFGPVWYFDIVTINNDEDNDQVPDDEDECPNTPQGSIVDENGCVDENSSLDDDNDGVNNAYDECPDTPTGENVYSTGCSLSQKDDDKDGVSDNEDVCDDTPAGETVNENGCSDSQLDEDNDGVPDNIDECPGTNTSANVDAFGCSEVQQDSDKDGIIDLLDVCPDTPLGASVNSEGCSIAQIDDDNDGIVNDLDQCPNTPIGAIVDIRGCDENSKTFVPDNVLENYLETHSADGLFVSIGSPNSMGDGITDNDKVLTSRIINVNSLILAGRGISDFTGLEVMTNLETLNISQNPILKLNLSENIKLKYLDVQLSNLTSIDISNNSQLISLNINQNSLENLNLNNMPNLEILDCRINNLSSLDLSNNPKVKRVDFSYNQISDINLSSATSLEWLNCSDNNLMDLSLTNNDLLQYLMCYRNNLQCIEVNQFQLDNYVNSWLSDPEVQFLLNCNNPDTDNDGVINENDQCPDTPQGVPVNSNGCPNTIPSNLLVNSSAESGTSNWVLYGDSGFEQFGSSNVFFTKDIVDNSASLVQDVAIGSSNTNKYLLIIGNLRVENTVPGSITRHPYLYGIQMTATDQNVEYMQGQDMLHSAGAGVWQVGSGVFQIKENVEKIQLLLAQAIQVGDDPDGTKALYDDIELLIFDSMSEAIYYRDNIYNPTN